jgi:hypothetical protein
MSGPGLEDARGLADWRPPLGVVTVLLGFDAGDRGGAWRTELRNGLDCVRDAAKEAEHERRVALRATAERIGERFDDGTHRPPPHGEVGFVEVSEKGGTEHWWPVAQPPPESERVHLGEEPLLVPLLEVDGNRPCGVAVLSHERVRLLHFDSGALAELEDWELSVFSLDWRERKAAAPSNPAGAQGVSSSGHDRYEDRLEHNRKRFLGECAGLAGERLAALGCPDLLLFGPAHDADEFRSGFKAPTISLEVGGTADLVSTPTGRLHDEVAAAAGAVRAERESALVARALGEAQGGARGAAGRQDVTEALAEGRVELLVLDGGIGEAAEELLRAALHSGAEVTVVRGDSAAPLAVADGAAAVLRY